MHRENTSILLRLMTLIHGKREPAFTVKWSLVIVVIKQMSSQGTWHSVSVQLSSEEGHPLGSFQRSGRCWREGLEMSSIVTSLCHPPSRDTKPSTLPNHPLMKRFALVPSTLQEMKLRTTVHAPFSVWFIIEIYGEAKKSWLLRNNHSLEQICVIKQHVGINSTHRHCSDNNAVPFSKWIF